MQSNFWTGSKNLDRHKTFWYLKKDKALLCKMGLVVEVNMGTDFKRKKFLYEVAFLQQPNLEVKVNKLDM